MLTIYATSATVNRSILVDEMSIIYSQTPYLDGDLFGSYGNNEEGIDGVTGKFGPVIDTRKVMDFGVLRETFYMLTQDPSGRLHETTDNGTTEPSGWTVNEVGANCGALSAFSHDQVAGGRYRGIWRGRMDGLGQSLPGRESSAGHTQTRFRRKFSRTGARSIQRRIIPSGASMIRSKEPFILAFRWGLQRRQQDSVSCPIVTWIQPRPLPTSPPFRSAFTGHLIATDNSRKWSLWNMKHERRCADVPRSGKAISGLGCGKWCDSWSWRVRERLHAESEQIHR